MLTHYYFFKALDYPNDILDVWNGFEFGSILRPKVIAKYLRPRLRRAQRRSNQKIEHAFVSKRGSTPIVPLKRANYAHCLCLGGQVDSNLFVQPAQRSKLSSWKTASFQHFRRPVVIETSCILSEEWTIFLRNSVPVPSRLMNFSFSVKDVSNII